MGMDPVAVEDLLFDALQDSEGVDLWTGTADPDTGRVEAHFGLLVEPKLQPHEALQMAIMRFTRAAEAAGWQPSGGDAEVTEESHFEITYEGIAEVEEPQLLAFA